MKDNIELYGTVYNNAAQINASINSIEECLGADLHSINVVDNYSNDGTFEELLKLEKKFGNIKIFRDRCKRGKGRDIALRACSPGSIVTYVDFDSVYKEVFGELIRKGLNFVKEGKIVIAHNFALGYSEWFIKSGGWKNLNYGEDAEFFARILHGYPAVAVPVFVCINEKFGGERESRYATGIRYLLRKLDCNLDYIVGSGKTLRETMGYYRAGGTGGVSTKLRGAAGFLLYTVSFTRGKRRRYFSQDNYAVYNNAFVKFLKLPREMGITEKVPLIFSSSVKDEAIRRVSSLHPNILFMELSDSDLTIGYEQE